MLQALLMSSTAATRSGKRILRRAFLHLTASSSFWDQAERAIQQYRPLIDEEEMEMGKSDSGAVAKDREVVDSLETAIEAFRKRPQGFNGPLGGRCHNLLLRKILLDSPASFADPTRFFLPRLNSGCSERVFFTGTTQSGFGTTF